MKFEIILKLYHYWGWEIREFENPLGEKTEYLCVPIKENGIERFREEGFPIQTLKVLNRGLIVPKLSPSIREELIQEGKIDPKDKQPMPIVGKLQRDPKRK